MTERRHALVIVGAGFGGIGMAIRLKQDGHDDFVVIEQADNVGGTWRDNTYPGCACDIPSHLYSLSFAPNAGWSRRYPTQREIQDYLVDCVDRFGLRPHLRLGVRLKAARFDPADNTWKLDTAPGPGVVTNVLVLAMGLLHRPAMPSLPGEATFRGALFHSARWDHAVPLQGRHVAVIGTGASAIQFVPVIAETAAQITLFQRTPAWILPKHDPPSSARGRWAMRFVPLLRRLTRAWQYWTHEARALGFVRFPALLAAAERQARSYAKRQLHADDLREAVTPVDRMGCKRILLSNDFLASLNRDNVRLVTTPIATLVPDGVRTMDGVVHRANVLIFATGFQATDPFGEITLVGRDSMTLAHAWRDRMQARLGVAVTGFPNLFMLGGPNTGLGHNSIVFMLEAQISHVLRLLRLRHRRGAAMVELRAEAQAAFTRCLDRWMQRTIWLSGCRSWYLDRNGRNTTLWPGFSIGYWLRTRVVSQRHYRLGGGGVAPPARDCLSAPQREVEETADANQGAAGQHVR